MRRIILFIGFVLIGVAFVSAALMGLVMMRHGGAPVAYSLAGKPTMFIPGAYLSFGIPCLVLLGVLAYRWLRARIENKAESDEGEREH